MGKAERLIIYTLLAVLVVATFTDLGPIHAKDKPGEGTFRKVTVVDEEGRARIVLGVGQDDGAWLTLRDKKGNARVILDYYADFGRFSFIHGSGKPRAFLRSFANGAELILYDEKSNQRIALSSSADGAWLTLRGRESAINIYDNDALRAVLGSIDLQVPKTGTVIKRSPSSLVLFDKKGDVIWSTPQE